MRFVQGLNTELGYSVLSEVSITDSSKKMWGDLWQINKCSHEALKLHFKIKVFSNSIANIGLLGLAFFSSFHHFQAERILVESIWQISFYTDTSLRTLLSLISFQFPDTHYWASKRCLGLISHMNSNFHHSRCTWFVKGLNFWIFS